MAITQHRQRLLPKEVQHDIENVPKTTTHPLLYFHGKHKPVYLNGDSSTYSGGRLRHEGFRHTKLNVYGIMICGKVSYDIKIYFVTTPEELMAKRKWVTQPIVIPLLQQRNIKLQAADAIPSISCLVNSLLDHYDHQIYQQLTRWKTASFSSLSGKKY
ncbi:hypothetical protein AVEN_104679-1 [Araneus ventricosus]|uniref:Uncharacterized protein n=1 Tax=Araneus ventricosus TaxID=182803 RepID=A0A4Y2BBQ5_ARAVE|nr:hypothetical protein AVEN_104679-1 [Araneus ventricosus]